MNTRYYLGNPPAHIKNWIIENRVTRITFSDNSVETYNIGDFDNETLIGLRLKENDYAWTKQPKSVKIGNTVRSIGPSVFSDCGGLTSVTIPNSVTSIRDGAFFGCSGLTSVTIPNSVTSIGNEAFFGCERLTSVTIPNTVTSIGERAFYNCWGLTSVTIGNGVTSIGSSAFSFCYGLTSVTIGNGVTSIGDEAFYYCYDLTSITIDKTRDEVAALGYNTWGLGVKRDEGEHEVLFEVRIHCSDNQVIVINEGM